MTTAGVTDAVHTEKEEVRADRKMERCPYIFSDAVVPADGVWPGHKPQTKRVSYSEREGVCILRSENSSRHSFGLLGVSRIP
jgi:hypothetical protein